MKPYLASFCEQSGINKPFELIPIFSGRNSAVYRVISEYQSTLLKHYFQHVGDKRNRLNSEYLFLSFLNSKKNIFVAKPIAKDENNNLALYSFLPGIKPTIILDNHIEQAAEFLLYLHRLKISPNAMKLPKAADSCESIKGHINLVNQRIKSLKQIEKNHKTSDQFKEFSLFLKSKLVPAFENIKNEITAIYHEEINITQLTTISPSDFGFNNSLEYQNKLSFIDFEYAGWDSAAKLVCDFICQPEIPISISQSNLFIIKMSEIYKTPNFMNEIKSLLPLHRLKWCCILLNVFKEADMQRRAHSGVVTDNLQSMQLNKAKLYFEEHLFQYD
jgi:hypothetical protein